MRYALAALALLVSACAPVGPVPADGGDGAVVSRGLTAQPWEFTASDSCVPGSGVCVQRVRMEFRSGGVLVVNGYATAPACTPAMVYGMGQWSESVQGVTISRVVCAPAEIVCGVSRGDGCPIVRSIEGVWSLRGSELQKPEEPWAVYRPVSG